MKQVIVVRKDLKLGKGKLAAQVAHAAVEAADKSSFKSRWMSGGQKKSVLGCENEEMLLQVYADAKKANLPAALIRDAGRTQIPPGTLTCVGIGPAPEEDIDKITKDLKLL